MTFIKKYRFALLTVMTMTGLFGFISLEEQSSYWYFDGGQEIHWKAQPDVFAFRNLTHTQYAGAIDTTVVASILFRSDNPDKINVVFFKPGASASEITTVIQDISTDPSFEAPFPSITMVPSAAYYENLWYFANDLVMVTFISDSLATANASRIATQYDMTQYSTPVGIAGGNYTYFYRFAPSSTHPDGLELSRTIYINENTIVSDVEPNLVKIYSQPPTMTTLGITAPANEKEQFYVVNDGENTLRVYYQLHSTDGNLSIKVYDMFGRQLARQQVASGGNQVQMDISILSTGIYFTTLEDSNGKPLFTRKFRKI